MGSSSVRLITSGDKISLLRNLTASIPETELGSITISRSTPAASGPNTIPSHFPSLHPQETIAVGGVSFQVSKKSNSSSLTKNSASAGTPDILTRAVPPTPAGPPTNMNSDSILVVVSSYKNITIVLVSCKARLAD